MEQQNVDFDTEEFGRVVREMVSDLEEKFNAYEKTHGGNFTGSLAATLASEILVRIAITSPTVLSIDKTWLQIFKTATKSFSDYAEYCQHMNATSPGLDKKH